ncbi:MAG TPA: FHA domain-containing protein [Kofleriaceae bacterium]|nr:FHA domain-containing protein [Kofleriaceae bacterium]
MTGSQLTSYALAALGGVMIGLALVDVTRRRINVAAANSMIIKLALAGNLDRATKLCAAARGTYLDAIAAAIERSKDAGERSATEIAVHGAFDEVAKPGAARWLRMNERGLLGVVAVGGAVALAISSNELTPAHEVAAAVAALAGLWLLARRNYYATAIAQARSKVLPEIIAARLGGTSSTPSTVPPAPSMIEPSATAQFRIFRGDRLIETRSLSGIVKIGTVPAAQLRLGDDDQVSRMHAILEIGADQIQIIDLGSRTGTFVNGQKVNKAMLHDGDKIAVGSTRLELVHPGLPPPPARPASSPASPVSPAAPVAPPASSLASGTCPLCKHTEIKTVQRDDPRFRTLVCAACGYAQEFANLDALP